MFFTLGIAALPAFGVIRFDLWGGNHVYLGERLGLVEVAKAFAFPFLGVNILIVIASRLVGRYLCGFVCPWGAIARIAEWLTWNERKRKHRWVGTTTLLLFSLTMAAITFSFWVDWRVFRDGSPLAIGLSAGFILVTTLVLHVGGLKIGMGFCKDWCPSGLYFAVLGPETQNGIEFSSPDHCTDCKACDRVCPVDLLPREMSGGAHRDGTGFYPDGMSNFSLCIRCGDCVKVCEATTEKNEGPVPLRMGFLPEGARESRVVQPAPHTDADVSLD